MHFQKGFFLKLGRALALFGVASGLVMAVELGIIADLGLKMMVGKTNKQQIKYG